MENGKLDIDDLLLFALINKNNRLIRISDENGERLIPYELFLKMFDENGFSDFC